MNLVSTAPSCHLCLLVPSNADSRHACFADPANHLEPAISKQPYRAHHGLSVAGLPAMQCLLTARSRTSRNTARNQSEPVAATLARTCHAHVLTRTCRAWPTDRTARRPMHAGESLRVCVRVGVRVGAPSLQTWASWASLEHCPGFLKPAAGGTAPAAAAATAGAAPATTRAGAAGQDDPGTTRTWGVGRKGV